LWSAFENGRNYSSLTQYLSLTARHKCFPFPSLITCSVCDLGEQAKCRDDERTFRSVIEQLREHLSELTDQFNKLDTQVHMVSGKLAHLGDQLERKNLPRKRIEEARDLILEFYKFLGAGGGTFANVAVNWQGDENQLLEAASRINNLSSLCLELPDDERFLSAKQRVTVANQQLESALLERFRLHCVKRDLDVMKRISDVLVNSKCHPACVDILVGETLKVLVCMNLLTSVILLCLSFNWLTAYVPPTPGRATNVLICSPL
ncbi:exocyst complex component 5, partial [Paragonimus westermani]